MLSVAASGEAARPSAGEAGFGEDQARSGQTPLSGWSGRFSSAAKESTQSCSYDDELPPCAGGRGATSLSAFSAEELFEPCFSSSFRAIVSDLVDSRMFSVAVCVNIVLSIGLTLLHTSAEVSVSSDWYFAITDAILLSLFICEIGLVMYARGQKFFSDPWDVADLVLLSLNIICFAVPFLFKDLHHGYWDSIRILKLLRTVRSIKAVRILKTIRYFLSLQHVLNVCAAAATTILRVFAIVIIFTYIFAVVGKNFYGEATPEKFGTLWLSAFTLFDILTLADWYPLYRRITVADSGCWHFVIYLVIYIIIGRVALMNVIVAVLIDLFRSTTRPGSPQTNATHVVEVATEGNGTSCMVKDNVQCGAALHPYLWRMEALERNFELYRRQSGAVLQLVAVVSQDDDDRLLDRKTCSLKAQKRGGREP